MSDISRRNDALVEIAGQANAALKSEPVPAHATVEALVAEAILESMTCGPGVSAEDIPWMRDDAQRRHAPAVMRALDRVGMTVVWRTT